MTDQTYVAFCQAVGIPLTATQAAVAAVAFDGAPVPADCSDLFGFAGPVAPEARRTIGVLCGRNSGKTSVLCAGFVLWRAITADLSRLARGEIAFAPLVAPDRDLAKQALRFVTGTLEGSALATLVEHQDADSVTIRRPDGTRVCISVFAASRGGSAVRGKAIVGAALDEACFFRDASAVVNDSDIFKALTPRLMTGGAIVVASTPWIQAGLLFDLWKENFGAPDDALVIHAPTERMRPDDPELLERIRLERENDPDNAAREYDCAWLPHGAGNAFDSDALTRAVVESVSAADPARESIHIGGDLGLVNDPSAFVAVRDVDGKIDVIDVLEIKPRRGQPSSLTEVLRQAAEFAAKYNVRTIRVDHHSLPQARDAIERERISLALEPASESAEDRDFRFSSLIEAFKAGRVHIPRKHAALTDQLARIIATPKSGGGYRYEASRRDGNHCDAAMALILACEDPFSNARYAWALSELSKPATQMQFAILAAAMTNSTPDAAALGRLQSIARGLTPDEEQGIISLAYAVEHGTTDYLGASVYPLPGT